MKNIYKAWWMQAKHVNNFGDILTPLILDYYNIKYEYTEKSKANLICVGSIANFANDNSLVLGSGVAYRNIPLNSKAKWLFTRGPLTRENVIKNNGSCEEIYGDPAMLLPKILSSSNKTENFGYIPHINEYKIIKIQYPKKNIINLNNPNVKEVIKQITSCRKIMSSSLHGVIAAHAYGIPVAHVNFTEGIIQGDGTKYKDHYAAINIPHNVSTINNPIFTDCNNFDTSKIEDIFKSLK